MQNNIRTLERGIWMSGVEVVSNEYLQLQQDVTSMQKDWAEKCNVKLEDKIYNPLVPIITDVEFQVDKSGFIKSMKELIDYLQEKRPQLEPQLLKIRAQLEKENPDKWLHEAIVMNDFFFVQWAKENHVEEWLPIFIAESTSRVYIREAVKQLNEELKISKVKGCCPACGEPPRMAVVGKKGGKELLCPRCHYKWNEKKHSCSYCENEEHDQMIVLKPEGQEREEVIACKKCNSYTKVIDTRAMIKKEAPEILDLKTIHLDYIAQDEGFGLSDEDQAHLK